MSRVLLRSTSTPSENSEDARLTLPPSLPAHADCDQMNGRTSAIGTKRTSPGALHMSACISLRNLRPDQGWHHRTPLQRRPLVECKAALGKLLLRSRGGIQYVEHAEGHGDRMFAAVCDLGLEGIVSKKLDAPYGSGPSKAWIKVKNPNAAASMRVLDGAF